MPGAGDLEAAHKLTDTIKNIDKICMLEEDVEESGYSGARHYVRGHYSRDGRGGGSYDGYPMARRDSRGRYSRDGRGGNDTMSYLTAAMASSDPEDREMIQRLMDKMNDR